MDPQTGDIKALIGGRDYGLSQLNRARGEAAARVRVQAVRLRGGAEHGLSERHRRIVRRPRTLQDEPTTFYYDDRTYQPSNFGDQLLRHGDGSAGDREIAEHPDRQNRRNGRIPQRARPGEARRA